MDVAVDNSVVPNARRPKYRRGVAPIKQEFIVSDHERKLTLECISEEDKKKCLNVDKTENQDGTEESSDGPTAEKKPRVSKREKKKLRGQNKARPLPFRFEREKNLCRSLIDAEEDNVVTRCGNERCQFIHNVSEYLAIKPPDIGATCYVYTLRGHCERGITCRFGSNHINSVGRNITNTTLYEKYQSGGLTTINALKKELQYDLRKWKYSFARSENIIDKNDAGKKKKKGALLREMERKRRASEAAQKGAATNVNVDKERDLTLADISEEEEIDNVKIEITIDDNGHVQADDATLPIGTTVEDNANVKEDEVMLSKELTSSTKEEGKLGPVSDHDITVMKPREKVVIDWKDKLYLSPLTTVGNLPFRRICKEFGVDITCGEMAMANSILRGMPQEWALMKRHSSEDLFGVQLCGNNPYSMTKCAQLLEEQTVIDFIDVNLGCPIDFIYQRGEGSGLLKRSSALASVIKCMSQVITIPLTVKTRTGVVTDKNIAHTLVPKFREWGASLITIHGRSREQRYTKTADWAYIDCCAQIAAPLPLFLNGDILSFEDYERARRECPAVSGAMIGRGALIKPWIFTEIKERRNWDISSAERLDLLKKYVNYGLEHWGSDTKGVENTRKFLLEWLSFLYRYIPIGVLEHLPQRINDRPPSYRGRDELETLMASNNCADWVKISEMLLGPVPDQFHFLPKHKANSWT